jgi:hypothetical protein
LASLAIASLAIGCVAIAIVLSVNTTGWATKTGCSTAARLWVAEGSMRGQKATTRNPATRPATRPARAFH